MLIRFVDAEMDRHDVEKAHLVALPPGGKIIADGKIERIATLFQFAMGNDRAVFGGCGWRAHENQGMRHQ